MDKLKCDVVYSKDEQLHIVDSKFIYHVDENMVKLYMDNNLKIEGITQDHKILAIKKEDFDNGVRIPIWIEAGKLEEDDVLCEIE